MVGGVIAHPAATPEPCCRYLQVTNRVLIDHILAQGKGLVRAIEALGTIEPTGSFERALARLLMAAYKRRCVVLWRLRPPG